MKDREKKTLTLDVRKRVKTNSIKRAAAIVSKSRLRERGQGVSPDGRAGPVVHR